MTNNFEISQYEKAIDQIIIRNRRSESLSSSLCYENLYKKDLRTFNYSVPVRSNSLVHSGKDKEITPLYTDIKGNNHRVSDYIISTVQRDMNFNKAQKETTKIASPYKGNDELNNYMSDKKIDKVNFYKESCDLIKKEETDKLRRDDSFNKKNEDPSFKFKPKSPFRQKGIEEIEKINKQFIEGKYDKFQLNMLARSLNQPVNLPDIIVKRNFTKSIAVDKLNKIEYLRPYLRVKADN